MSLRGIAVSFIAAAWLAGHAVPADAYAVRSPPIPPSCRQAIADNGGTSGLWRGQFVGSYERGMIREYVDWFSRVGCFRSEAACRKWIYDVRSHTIFHTELIVKCEPLSR
jgi:hypothetical protein